MHEKPDKSDQCVLDVEPTTRFYEEIPSAVKRILTSYSRDDCFDPVLSGGQGGP